MKKDIKECVDMRRNFLKEYFIVPESLKAEVDDFLLSLEALGETCDTPDEFEERFLSEGYSDRYNSIYPNCIPQNQGVYDDSSVRDDIPDNKVIRPGLLQSMAEDASDAPDFELSDENSLLKRRAEAASETPDFTMSDENSLLKRRAEAASEEPDFSMSDENSFLRHMAEDVSNSDSDAEPSGFFGWFKKFKD